MSISHEEFQKQLMTLGHCNVVCNDEHYKKHSTPAYKGAVISEIMKGFLFPELPEEMIIIGDLNISSDNNSPCTPFPSKNLVVYGDLLMENTNYTKISDKLVVHGELDAQNSALEKLPDNLSVQLLLNVENTPLEALPENLTIIPNQYFNGRLIAKNTNIKEIPESLKFTGELLLENSKVTKIANFHTFDFLCLSNTPIEQLPEYMNVKHLWIHDTNIKKIPPNVETESIHKDFIYFDEFIARNPDAHMKVLDDVLHYYGDINSRQLPDNMTVHGNVMLSRMTKFPENLTVMGDLIITAHRNITETPESLVVHGNENYYTCFILEKLNHLKEGEVPDGKTINVTYTSIKTLPKWVQPYIIKDEEVKNPYAPTLNYI